MPRKTATTTTAEQPVSTEPMAVMAHEAPASLVSPGAPESLAGGERSHAAEVTKVSEISDPRALLTASLGDGKKIELLRSHRFNQIQLRSDEPLSDKHQDMLKDAGWTDRTEKEGIYTRQLPREAEKWREAADTEKLFKQIANEMRANKKLGAVLGE
ncbi:MAG TPA: hypothetical protein VHY09_01395 [Candidatus Methylacidiphilales bacterium]|jgi:hypothetical protein|nr:hypothetical protein [Candidatus Methylacidiphilales bacterium]